MACRRLRAIGERGLPAPVEEVRVGAAVRAADPAAELVELRQAERVGADDDDRVRVRDVEARLDDRRADQDVEAPLGEVEHHPLEHALRHLPVTDGDLRLAARGAGCAPRPPRWSRPGCGRRRPARPGRSRG